jgi:glycosyltransferase involved in cell wall biosynthesis
MTTPLFSIIIPTFNSEKTLRASITSVLSQTYMNFEILIIDGLSKDNTIFIANSFNDLRIKIISEKDFGIYDAMNKAIHIAEGEWLYFLGSDDQLSSSYVLQEINYFINTNQLIQIVYGNVISSRFGGIYAREFDAKKLYVQNICHQSIFFKNEIFKLTGLFNRKYKFLADYDHNIKWFLNKKIKKKYIDLVISFYADGGLSSINYDNIFLSDKRKLFLNYFFELDFDFCVNLFKEEIQIQKVKGKYSQYLFYNIQFLIYLFYFRIKGKIF